MSLYLLVLKTDNVLHFPQLFKVRLLRSYRAAFGEAFYYDSDVNSFCTKFWYNVILQSRLVINRFGVDGYTFCHAQRNQPKGHVSYFHHYVSFVIGKLLQTSLKLLDRL